MGIRTLRFGHRQDHHATPKALDEVAYIRFASVYLEFAYVSEFMDELRGLVGARAVASDKKKK